MNVRTLFFSLAIPAAVAGGPVQAALVTNGGFETENPGPTLPPPGWTTSGNGLTIDSVFAASGTYDVSFGAGSTDPAPGILSQTIATVPGASYTVSFSLLDESGLSLNAFTASFGTFSRTYTGDAANSYTVETFVVPGAAITGAGTVLRFRGTNDFSSWNLDDVSVVQNAIPEPSGSLLLLGAAMLFGRFVRGRPASRRA